jgi:hypothetical protein
MALGAALAIILIGIDAIFIIVVMTGVATDVFGMLFMRKLDQGALMRLQLRRVQGHDFFLCVGRYNNDQQ